MIKINLYSSSISISIYINFDVLCKEDIKYKVHKQYKSFVQKLIMLLD